MITGAWSTKADLSIVDKFYMMPYDFVVITDKKLREAHDTNKMIGRKYALLSGIFLQMKSAGTSIYNSLCKIETTFDLNCRKLISEFKMSMSKLNPSVLFK